MNIRTRILLGYGYLVSLLVIAAVGAAIGFHRLGVTIGRVLTDNFDSVRSSMVMLEALERQETAVLGALLGDPLLIEEITASELDFQHGLEKARANVTLDGEQDMVRRIGEGFDQFRAARDTLLASTPAYPLRSYNEATLQRFDETRAAVVALLDANHVTMLLADQQVQRNAVRGATLLGLLVALAVLSLGLLSREMQRSVLDRLTDLRDVADAIAGGDRSRRALASRQDELASVARQLNAALDAEQAIEGEMRGRVAWYRQLLLGLFHKSAPPATLLTVAGDVVATSLPAAEASMVERVRQALVADRALVKAIKDDTTDLTGTDPATGRIVHLQLILAPTQRPVGWLAVLE